MRKVATGVKHCSCMRSSFSDPSNHCEALSRKGSQSSNLISVSLVLCLSIQGGPSSAALSSGITKCVVISSLPLPSLDFAMSKLYMHDTSPASRFMLEDEEGEFLEVHAGEEGAINFQRLPTAEPNGGKPSRILRL